MKSIYDFISIYVTCYSLQGWSFHSVLGHMYLFLADSEGEIVDGGAQTELIQDTQQFYDNHAHLR